MEFQCFPQIRKSLLFGFTLAGNVNSEALGDVPIPLTPDGRGK
jgi:hypothetical protein